MSDEYHILRRLISLTPTERGAHCVVGTDRGGTVTFRIDFLSPSSFRYRMLPRERDRKRFEIADFSSPKSVSVHVSETPEAVLLATAALEVRLRRDPWEVSVVDGEGNVIARENADDQTILDSWISPPSGVTVVEGQVTSVRGNMHLFPDERLFGFGEKFTPFDKKGQRLLSWTVDTYSTNTERSYKNVPFFMSTRGYGIFLNTTCRIAYDLGAASSVSYSFTVEDDELDLCFFHGPRMAAILDAYTGLVGRAQVPPKWSFGLWMSKFGYESRREVEDVCERFRAEDIPCDVICLDPPWMRNGKRCDFVWDEDAFPKPQGLMRELAVRGFKTCLWEHPYIPVESELYAEGAARGYFLLRPNGTVYVDRLCLNGGPNDNSPFTPGALVDFTNPRAVDWYKEKHRRLLEMGAAVFKTDFGEHVPEDAVFSNGLTGREMHNVYPLLYQKAVFEAVREAHGRGIVWGRSAYAGSQAYPVQWSGDSRCTYASMASNLRGGLSYALSGFPFWSHDIGGFKGTPTPDLYVRWSQFGLFTSHARCHGTTSRHPWDFGREATDIFRFYAKLRYRLIPYLYSYAHVAHAQSLPILRPMVLEYQEDPNTFDKDQQYLLGGELLVAPVFSETGEVSVYLPRGGWVDFWSDAVHEGPTTLRYKADLRTLPLFVKANAIIPMGPETSSVEDVPVDPLTLRVYCQSHAEFVFHDDEATVTFVCDRQETGYTLSIGASRRSYVLELHAGTCPERITVGREAVPPCTAESFNDVRSGWYFDPHRRLTLVRFEATGAIEATVETA